MLFGLKENEQIWAESLIKVCKMPKNVKKAVWQKKSDKSSYLT